MIVTKEREGAVTVIRLSGRLSMGPRLTRFRELFDSLLASGERSIVIDLSDATFLDSAMLGELMACRRRLTRDEGRIVISGACGKVQDLFSLTRFDRLIDTHDDLVGALDALSPRPDVERGLSDTGPPRPPRRPGPGS